MEKDVPFVNLEDAAGKVVGIRKAPDAWEASMALQKTGRSFHNRWGGGVIRGRVYRYNSFQEADQDLMDSYVREWFRARKLDPPGNESI
jgi:hypothetical protein